MAENLIFEKSLELAENLVKKTNKGKVYHYTTLATFKNILETKSLHLSHLSCLNDLTEFEDGVNYVMNRLLQIDANKQYKESIEKCREILLHLRNLNFCIFSTCLHDDLLSQWRAYSDDGHGIAIGLDAKELRKICKKENFIFGKCLFSDVEKEVAFEKIIRNWKKIGETFELKQTVEEIIGFLGPNVGNFSLFSKNKGFSEELEVRIVTHPSVVLSLKDKGSRMITYHKLDIQFNLKSLIKEIRIGPCSKYSEVRKALEVLLQKADIKDCIIKESIIPYRSVRALSN